MNTFITIGEKKCVERREKASRQTTEFQERRENAGNLRGIYCFWNCPLFRLQMKKRVAYIMEAVSLKKKKKKIMPKSFKSLAGESYFPTGQSMHFYGELLWLLRKMTSEAIPLSFPLIVSHRRAGQKWSGHFAAVPPSAALARKHLDRQCQANWVAIWQKICSDSIYVAKHSQFR